MTQFKPEVLITTNVKESLAEFAATHNLAPETIGFDILSFATYYSKLPSTKWVPVDAEKHKQILHVKNLSDPDLYFKEQYKIRVYAKEPLKECRPIITLSSDTHRSKIMATVQQGSLFALTKSCKAEFIHEIKRKLILAECIIGLFMVDLEVALMPLQLAVQRDGGLNDPMTLIVAQALKPSTNIAPNIIKHFLQKHEDQRTAYESGVVKDELILEYELPHIALAGRNCLGRHLQALGPKITANELIYINPEAVYKRIESNKIYYYAKKAGYVAFEDAHLDVSNQLRFDQVSLSKTGSITLGDDKEIALKIAANEDVDDAIGQGVDIEVSSVDVRGSIAGNTSIKAQNVTIGAQTHKKTTIEVAETAQVYLHRGDLKAKEAKIDKLENGLIEAEIAEIGEVLGGEIKAREIIVRTLYSNARLIASKSITIGSIVGTNNTLYIAPARVQNEEKKIKELEEARRQKQAKYLEEERHYQTRIRQFEANYDRISEIRKQVVAAIKEGREPLTAHAVKLKQFALDQERLDRQKKEIEALQHEAHEIALMLDEIQNAMQNAVVSLRGSWDGHSAIIYENPYSGKIEKHIPQGLRPKIIYKELLQRELIVLKEESDTMDHHQRKDHS